MSQVQNIVIVGASCAGHTLANTLVPLLPPTHRIILIDASSYSYYPVGALRGAVVPGWEDKITVPLTTATVFGKSSPHQVVAPNKVVELKEGSLVLEKEFEGSHELPFFKCVLAIGTSQPYPMRGDATHSLEEARSKLKSMQGDVAKAQKVVIIGAGPVGLEYAGEIRELFPDKSITLVHSGAHPLNPANPAKAADANSKGSPHGWQAPLVNPKLSTAVEAALKTLEIEFIGNSKVNIPSSGSEGEWDGSFGLQNGLKKISLPDGKVIEADLIFMGLGNQSNASFVEKADSAAVVDGLIRVDEYLKVASSNTASPLQKNYYAIGDCCTTPGWKTMQGAQADAAAVAPNVLADIKGRPLKAYKRGTVHGMMIPLGPKHGAGYVTFPLLGDTMFPEFMVKKAKAEGLFVDQYLGRFKGKKITA